MMANGPAVLRFVALVDYALLKAIPAEHGYSVPE